MRLNIAMESGMIYMFAPVIAILTYRSEDVFMNACVCVNVFWFSESIFAFVVITKPVWSDSTQIMPDKICLHTRLPDSNGLSPAS